MSGEREVSPALAAAREYLRRGIRVIPIPRGEKAPRIKNWTDLRLEEADLEARFGEKPMNVGLLLGDPSNGLVDIDLDCVEAVALAPLLLPPTNMVFGRPSKPASHYLYRVNPAPPKTLRLLDDAKGTLVEMRSTGCQTVAPPSLHPSGEAIEWVHNEDPSEIDSGTLENSVRLLAASSLLARVWPSDGRHELAMAVGGALGRAGYDEEEIGTAVEAICDYAGDEKCADRVRTAIDSAGRVASSGAAYGVPKLVDHLGKPVANRLAEILQLRRENATTRQRDRAFRHASGAELWHTSDDEAYASIEVNGHIEHRRVNSRAFRRWVMSKSMREDGNPMPKAALDEAIANAEALAIHRGPVAEAHTRIAECEGKIYIDLCDVDWRVVEVRADGWSVVERPPVKFVRSKGMLPLPDPERGGSLDLFNKYINVGNEQDRRLFTAAIIAAFAPNRPYPITVLTGEQGTSKTTMSRVFRAVIDPNKAPARSMPRTEQDIYVAAVNGHVLAFDNVSYIPAWLSDALCRVSTGGGFSTRELFTNLEEVLVQIRKPVVMNGIPFTIDRPDLLDRAIILTLPVISREQRKTERQYWAEFQRDHPFIFGAILDVLSGALANLPLIALDGAPRMADVAEWLTAAEEKLGWAPGTFIADYEANRSRSMADTAVNDPLVAALRKLLKDGPVECTASELLGRINAAVPRQDRPKYWPQSANRLSGRLRALAPALRTLNIEVELDRRRPSDNNKLIVLYQSDGDSGDEEDEQSDFERGIVF